VLEGWGVEKGGVGTGGGHSNVVWYRGGGSPHGRKIAGQKTKKEEESYSKNLDIRTRIVGVGEIVYRKKAQT